MGPKIWLSSTDGYKLSPKNVAALKTMFHITTSLGHLLGEGWHIVLGTVNCLDCILAMPRTIAGVQVGIGWPPQVGSRWHRFTSIWHAASELRELTRGL